MNKAKSNGKAPNKTLPDRRHPGGQIPRAGDTGRRADDGRGARGELPDPKGANPEAADQPRLEKLGAAHPKPGSSKTKRKSGKPEVFESRVAVRQAERDPEGDDPDTDGEGPQGLVRSFDKLTPEGIIAKAAIALVERQMERADDRHAKMGRPTKFTEARWTRILQRQSLGHFLEVICREERLSDPEFPTPDAVRDWMVKDDKDAAREGRESMLSTALARARKEGLASILRDTVKIADGDVADMVATPFGIRLNAGSIQRDKLRVETRLKALAILDPGIYGAKVEVAGNPERPLEGDKRSLDDYGEQELMEALAMARQSRLNAQAIEGKATRLLPNPATKPRGESRGKAKKS